MKRFKFNLEVVLQERKRVEDLKLRDWTIALQFLQKLIEEKTSLEQRLSSAIDEATSLSSLPQNSAGQFTTIDKFISGVKLRIEWKIREIERASKISERKRFEYVQARQKREVLEKLKDRRRQEHKELAKKYEIRVLDDIYTNMRRQEEEGPEEYA